MNIWPRSEASTANMKGVKFSKLVVNDQCWQPLRTDSTFQRVKGKRLKGNGRASHPDVPYFPTCHQSHLVRCSRSFRGQIPGLKQWKHFF